MSKLEKYSFYKDSGVEWIGEIPVHWETTKLKYISRLTGGFPFDGQKFHQDVGVNVIRIGDIKSKIDLNKCIKSIESNIHKNTKIIKNDTLIALSGATTGKSCFVRQKLQNSYINQRIAKFNYSNSFLYFGVSNAKFKKDILLGADGSAQENISNIKIENMYMPYPPKEEQIKIANFLDKKTAQIDKAIKQKEELISLLKERRQVLINNAVTKGIDKTVIMKDSGVEWIGEIPEHWEIVKSKRLFMARKERARKSDLQLTASQKHGVIYQKDYMELEGRKVTQVETNYEILKRVEPNDFLISMRSFQGGIEYCRYEGSVSSAYVPLIPIKHVVSEYFKYLFKSYVYIQALASTSNLVRDGQALRFDNFSLVDLIIIPEQEQENIAKYLDTETVKIDKSINLQQKQIEKLKEYKVTLIDSVVTGKVRVA